MKRAKKPKPKMVYSPNRCVVLAIDPGAKAGAAISLPGKIVSAYAALTGYEHNIVEMAIDLAANTELPLVVVRETWTMGRFGKGESRMNPATLAGLATAWGRWEGALLSRGIKKKQIVKVNAQTWKARTIGCVFGRTSKGDKAAAVQRSAAIFSGRIPSEDAADAICIAEWSWHAGEVEEAIPKRAIKPRPPETPRPETLL